MERAILVYEKQESTLTVIYSTEKDILLSKLALQGMNPEVELRRF